MAGATKAHKVNEEEANEIVVGRIRRHRADHHDHSGKQKGAGWVTFSINSHDVTLASPTRSHKTGICFLHNLSTSKKPKRKLQSPRNHHQKTRNRNDERQCTLDVVVTKSKCIHRNQEHGDGGSELVRRFREVPHSVDRPRACNVNRGHSAHHDLEDHVLDHPMNRRSDLLHGLAKLADE